MRVVSYREGTIAAKTEGMGYTTLINPYFTRWTNQIELCLATRDPKKLVRSLKARGMNDICEEDIWGYRKGELRELYLECMRHSAEYSAPLCGKDLLIVSHPTYIHGSHVRHIDTDERRDSVEEYEANIQRFVNVLVEFGKKSQFIVITHNKKTVTGAKTLLGVTMQESGVSKIISIRLEDEVENEKTKVEI